MSILALYRISLTEHERDWGQRPDGYIFTMSREDAQDYIKNVLNLCQKIMCRIAISAIQNRNFLSLRLWKNIRT